MPEQGGIDRQLAQPILPDLRRGLFGRRATISRIDMFERVEQLEERVDKIWEYLREQQQALAHSHDLVTQRVNELPEMLWLPFFQDNVAAGQTAVALSDGRSTRGYCAAEEGSVVAIAVRSNEARTAGTLTLEAYIGGVATGLTVVLDATNATTNSTLQDQGKDTFTRGAAIDCRITTSAGWTPVTADIIVSVAVVAARGVR